LLEDAIKERYPELSEQVEKSLRGNDPDRVLWTLTEHGGSMTQSELARRLHMKMDELDLVLKEESAVKIKLTEVRGKLVVRLREG
jgi:hypothetical protein